MRIQLAASVLALSVTAFATPGEAQSQGRNGNGGPSFSNGASRGAFSGGGRSSFSQRGGLSQAGTSTGARSRSIQPPPPGGSVAGSSPRAIQGIRPPPPGGSVGPSAGGPSRPFRSIQPPPPGGSVTAGGTARPAIRSIQPPPPGVGPTGGNGGSRALQGPRPPLTGGQGGGGSLVSSAAVIGGAGAATSVLASQPAVASEGRIATTAAAPVGSTGPGGDLPPLEMLATVGAPIVPLAERPAAGGGRLETSSGRVGQPLRGAVVSAAAAVETCNVPGHGRGYRFWRRY
jgi:hypothetical protein